ncbi:hypothetical protein DFH08DRAFT_54040 [Mycena albidolilacea]|uniref:NACHT domain-containing protein n=1 Tax=Mycena albidolilacea TaxID=1033008 RepID=A0AAD6Z2H8_9AGAR|nr:hypothetical protein DFH08DRAFT_54040 [Mycena albidolilacea]
MPADRRSKAPQTASDRRTMINHISGGRGGPGGHGHRAGIGGAGGHGMGPTLNFDISAGNLTVNNLQQDSQRGIEILHYSVEFSAIHDSAESFPQPKCHPETRTEMLNNFHNWAKDPDSKTIFWLFGPAGAGKSAIMQTLAGRLKDDGILGGSFFFKRGHATRGKGITLFATLAYQLALAVPSLRSPISQIVETDPSLIRGSIKTQMNKLISEPCHSYEDDDHITILIDGLDECEGQDVQREILRTILDLSFDRTLPLRFIIASRPEPHIREIFDLPVYSSRFGSQNVEQSFEDVRRYLLEEFARIHREHRTMASVPSPWPSPDVLWKLERNSSGHFIYAATIISFVDDKNYRPTERLAIVLAGTQGSHPAFDTLDQLYMTVLGSVPRQAELVPILCAIANFDLSTAEIDALFEFEGGEASLLLRGLHSILEVPSKPALRPYISAPHASFMDFLKDKIRSRNFYVGSLDHRMHLARCFLQLYAREYEQPLLERNNDRHDSYWNFWFCY